MKLQISKRAAVQRLDRKLQKQGRLLRAVRKHDETVYYIVDAARGIVTSEHSDLSKLCRELRAISAWEQVNDAR